MTDWKIPLFTPDLDDADIEAVCAPLRDKWLTMGEVTQAFEEEFARRCGANHAIAVSSGTAALHLALLALEVKPKEDELDEVAFPSFTFAACGNVVLNCGAFPVFIDLNSEDDWTISPEDLRNHNPKACDAMIAVHYAGFPCRMDELIAISKERNFPIIEDCAHALFSQYNGQTCGTIGDIGCFSFFSNKNMTTGEGGMLTTQNAELAQKLRELRSHGMTSFTLDRHQGRAISYDVTNYGLNYRIDEMRSALGLSQLRKLDENLQKRRALYHRYVSRLKNVEGLSLPFQDRDIEEIGIHIFPLLLDANINREAFMQTLKEQGIQTSIHYPPMHYFTAYDEFRKCVIAPITDTVASREVTLPFFPAMTEEQVETVCRAVEEALTRRQ